MWKDYAVHTTKEKIIETANTQGIFGNIGGFVKTDGAWCMTRTPEEFKEMLELCFNFEVTECKKALNSTAIATTKCGLQLAWNGHCKRIL